MFGTKAQNTRVVNISFPTKTASLGYDCMLSHWYQPFSNQLATPQVPCLSISWSGELNPTQNHCAARSSFEDLNERISVTEKNNPSTKSQLLQQKSSESEKNCRFTTSKSPKTSHQFCEQHAPHKERVQSCNGQCPRLACRSCPKSFGGQC